MLRFWEPLYSVQMWLCYFLRPGDCHSGCACVILVAPYTNIRAHRPTARHFTSSNIHFWGFGPRRPTLAVAVCLVLVRCWISDGQSSLHLACSALAEAYISTSLNIFFATSLHVLVTRVHQRCSRQVLIGSLTQFLASLGSRYPVLALGLLFEVFCCGAGNYYNNPTSHVRRGSVQRSK